MNGLIDKLFGPLGKEYCNWFYFLSIFSFIMFVLALLTALSLAVSKKTKNYTVLFIAVFQPFLLYFVNRLFYSMCVNSIHM
jgi:hypothetical protein